MRKMFSKVVVGLVSVSLILSTAACGGAKQQQNANNSQTNQTATKEEPKVTYEFMKNGSFPEYQQDGGEGKKKIIEKAAKDGIPDMDFNVTFLSGQPYFDKLNVLAASQQLPDLFDINLVTVRKFADQGLLFDLTNYAKNMPSYQQYHPKAADSALMVNGKTYAFSTAMRPEPYNGNAMNGLVIRKDWLDKLGLQMPDTIDKLYEVMKAFVTKDPDGNGKDDTFGIGLSKPGAAGSVILGTIFGAYGIAPEAWVEKDGKLVKGYTLPEMKLALETLQKWYKEKLIDPDFLVTDAKLANEKMVNSKYGIYSNTAFFVDPYNEVHAALRAATPTAKIVMMEAPKGPDGKRGIYGGNMAAGTISISANTKAPNRLVRYLDWTVNEEPNGGFFLTTHGVEGVHYSYDAKTNRITQLSTDPDKNKYGVGNSVRFLSTLDRRWMNDSGIEAATITNKYLIEGKYFGTVPAEVDYPDIPKLYDDYFYKIMLGNLPASAWDEFVKKYYEQGGKVIEQQVNDEYTKSKK